MMDIIIASCSIALVLYIWLETDAFVEYVKMLRLDRNMLFMFLRVNEYEEYISKNLEEDMTYPDFLSYECGSFFTTLISCPICVSVWLSIFSGFYLSFTLFPVINIISITLFLLIKILFKKAYDGP